MALGLGQMLLDPGDFALEQLDPLIELTDRQRAKVLLDEQGQWVAGLRCEEVILIHHSASVDRPKSQVNKSCGGS